MKTTFEGKIPSVNYHLWEPCNMRCKFCFATFQNAKNIVPKGHIGKEQSIRLVREIGNAGFEKITFAGGEPTLCPWISDLIYTAKESGMTTMMVTNGTGLDDDFLISNQGKLDWIILSIDSILDDTNINSGRAVAGKRPLDFNTYKNLIDEIERYGYQLKINTVVHRLNYQENITELIQYAQPERWKVFQVLPIKGENDKHIDEFIISEEQFFHFMNTHRPLKESGIMITENNSEMKDSYVMIDPAGRFFTNKNGIQEYSDPIIETGIEQAYEQMNYNYKKFIGRGGLYQWNKN
ncbi:viperin family antiviral radical SAM protein [uncultured Chryseobacterium sp.]|uniref:viperin family antiviral radical SAM protein n=1 Tax=uncultured Chryseobacterium sp. TaxID=259322 RepID=UPI0025E6BD9A|nr:viperin family antiviral radical SAM protein [uncultured Chryseobacterium sp.]